MAPHLTPRSDGSYALRSTVEPGVRVTIGVFATKSEAVKADRRFVETGILPSGRVFAFKYVTLAADGSWAFEREGRMCHGFATAAEAARERRRAVDNVSQRARRAEFGYYPCKKDKTVKAPTKAAGAEAEGKENAFAPAEDLVECLARHPLAEEMAPRMAPASPAAAARAPDTSCGEDLLIDMTGRGWAAPYLDI